MNGPRTEAGKALLDLRHPLHSMGHRSMLEGIRAIEAEAALSAPRTPAELPHPDAGNRERNHYDWFMPENPTAAVDEYLDDFEAKCREGLTDPFMHDMSQAVLPLIAAYRQSRGAA